MVRSSQLLSRAVVSVALAFPMALALPSFAQDATPASSMASAVSPLDPAVKKSADDLWHYAQVARYELAAAEVKKLTEGAASPVAVLRAFEAVAADRKQDLDATLARWASVEPMKASTKTLSDFLAKGQLALSADQSYIEDNIKRLIINERAYQLAVERLRVSGELAVPLMIQYLRSADMVQYHGSIRRALVDMGKSALSPLLASTQMKDARVLVTVITVLGDMGYDPAIPYLLRLATGQDSPSSVRNAAASALVRLGANGSLAPSDAYLALGEKFYYDQSMITAELSKAPVAFMWYWSDERGLTKLDVPPSIFNELMAMRSAEYSLMLDKGKDEAVSLWLAANYKREVELPAGAVDPTRMAGQPNGDYYGTATGARYLNDVLTRTLHDHSSAVALKAVHSLEEIVGTSSVFADVQGTPLASALSYPDKVVRFESAYAIGSAMPATSFAGSDRVVPILAEMVAQTGTPGVVVIGTSDVEVNKAVDDLKTAGYWAVGATSAETSVTRSTELPSVDAVVILGDVAMGVTDQVLALTASAPRLALTPKVIVTATAQSPYAQRAAVDTSVNITQATDAAGLKTAIDTARARGGSNPLDEAAATEGALRSLTLMEKLAIAKVPTLDLAPARPTLINGLDDKRPDVIKWSGKVLALAGGKEGQLAILQKATNEKTPDDQKIALLDSLSTSAKTYGNTLPADGVAALEKVVEGEGSLEVRAAASKARGALNLPPQEAKALILKQAKM